MRKRPMTFRLVASIISIAITGADTMPFSTADRG